MFEWVCCCVYPEELCLPRGAVSTQRSHSPNRSAIRSIRRKTTSLPFSGVSRLQWELHAVGTGGSQENYGDPKMRSTSLGLVYEVR